MDGSGLGLVQDMHEFGGLDQRTVAIESVWRREGKGREGMMITILLFLMIPSFLFFFAGWVPGSLYLWRTGRDGQHCLVDVRVRLLCSLQHEYSNCTHGIHT